MLRSVLRLVPLNGSGLAVLMLSGAALRFGITRRDMVFTLAGVWGLAALIVLGLAALAAVWRVRRDIARAGTDADRLEPLNGVESLTLISGFAIRRRVLPLVCEPRWSWIEPPATIRAHRRGRRLREQATPGSRWMGEVIERELLIEDLLGLWRFRARIREARKSLILPDVGRVSATDLMSCLSAGDLLPHPFGPPRGDRVDFRTYTRSDPARLILWKVYARTRELLVRVAEPARTPEARPIVYLVAGKRDHAAAGVARLVMESQLLGEETRFAADGSPEPSREPRDVRSALAQSRAHRARGGSDLERTLSYPDVGADDPVVLICPASEGRWLHPVLHQISRNPGRFLVIAAGDAAADRTELRGWRKLIWNRRTSQEQRSGLPMHAMLRSMRPVIATGARAVLVDRRGGQVRTVGDGWALPEAGVAESGGLR